MNYLAHAYLTKSKDPMVLFGNMMGDFVKGDKYKKMSLPIQEGLMLHRHIDTYTDANNIVREAKNLFRPSCGLYSGILVDTLMDHFLANDKRIFASDKELQFFVKRIYNVCSSNTDLMSEKMLGFMTNMIKYNWLYNYKYVEGIHQSFTGMSKRMTNFPEAQVAIAVFDTHYDSLHGYYNLLIDELEQAFLVS